MHLILAILTFASPSAHAFSCHLKSLVTSLDQTSTMSDQSPVESRSLICLSNVGTDAIVAISSQKTMRTLTADEGVVEIKYDDGAISHCRYHIDAGQPVSENIFWYAGILFPGATQAVRLSEPLQKEVKQLLHLDCDLTS